jgi:hypothetical protein
LELDKDDGWIPETAPLKLVGTSGGGGEEQGGVDVSKKKGASRASLGSGKGGTKGGDNDLEAKRPRKD